MSNLIPHDPTHLNALASALGTALLSRGWLMATAESCTGGGIAAAVTEIAGSSGWFERGFVTYSNEAKQELLGVRSETLSRAGAVSEDTAAEMAIGALRHSKASIAVSVTGIAGPGGATPGKPVGTVCFAYALATGAVLTRRLVFAGDRAAVRAQTVATALSGLLALAEGGEVPSAS
jgi:nicotinamide-nucleotide amidase